MFDIRIDFDTSTVKSDLFNNEIKSLCYSLAKEFNDKTSQEYERLIREARKKGNCYYLLKSNISYSALQKVKTFPILKEGRYKGGLMIIEKTRREMPFKLLAKRTIGYEKGGAFVGLEGAYSKELQGISGKRLERKIYSDIWMPVDNINDIEPQNGNDIITTIDINIQDVAETSLYRHLQLHEASHGCAVLMEVETGEIRAIANLTRLKNGEYAETYNWAIGESSEPGSTFKLASLIAILEDDIIDIDDKINTGDGTIKFADQKMLDSHEGGHGKITVKRAFEVSSNIGIAKIIYNAYSRNPQQYIDHLYRMHLNEPLGVEIQGEGMPYIKNTNNKSWSKISLPWIAIGYELRITPLQLLTFYNAVANDGIMVKPMFVKEIRQASELIKRFETEIINPSICSQRTIKKAQLLLEGVVENGTVHSVFKNSPYKVAGKTSTTQILDSLRYNKKKHRASFIGYFPADNPKYSCIVVVSNPSKGSYYGANVAAPVFREIADKVCATHTDIRIDNFHFANISYPNVQKAYQEDIRLIYKELGFPVDNIQQQGKWTNTKVINGKALFSSAKMLSNVVPDVIGMGVRDAVFLLEGIGLVVKVKGKGKVVKQSISPGEKTNKGNQITIILGSNATMI